MYAGTADVLTLAFFDLSYFSRSNSLHADVLICIAIDLQLMILEVEIIYLCI